MFLAARELRFAWTRFSLMGAVIALIAVLMVLLSGLSVGLVNDGVSGLKKLPVTSFGFEQGVAHESAFSRSVVDTEAVAIWQRQPGVAEATGYGNMLVNTHSDRGVEIDLALFGVDPAAFLSPDVADGARLSAPDGIVISATAHDAGLRIGDTVTVDRIGTRLRVVGVAPGQHTFGHVDVAYLPLSTWQRIKAGVAPGETTPEPANREITAVAVRAEPGRTVDLSAGDAAAGTESLTREQSYGASPGYTAETTTLQLIQVFLYAICALVVGSFFAIWVIQRRGEVAVLRAMGAPTGYLLRDALAQALIIMVAAVAIGAAIGAGVGSLIGGGVPFTLSASAIGLACLGLIVLGLLGATIAVVRIASVEPVTALGGNR